MLLRLLTSNRKRVSPNDVIILIRVGLESIFLKYILKVFGKYRSLILSVYHTSFTFIGDFNSTLLVIISKGISEYAYGNTIAKIVVPCNQSKHTIILNIF